MKVRPIRRLASTLVVAAALAPTACDFGTEPLFAIFWAGSFAAEPTAPFIISGTTEMVANPGDTSAGIFLDAAVTEAVTLGWHIRYGACNETGARVTGMDAFPPVTITESGSGTALSTIRRRLPAGSYAAEVFTAHDATGDRLACADLIQES